MEIKSHSRKSRASNPGAEMLTKKRLTDSRIELSDCGTPISKSAEETPSTRVVRRTIAAKSRRQDDPLTLAKATFNLRGERSLQNISSSQFNL
jgi:hypothetical protein